MAELSERRKAATARFTYEPPPAQNGSQHWEMSGNGNVE